MEFQDIQKYSTFFLVLGVAGDVAGSHSGRFSYDDVYKDYMTARKTMDERPAFADIWQYCCEEGLILRLDEGVFELNQTNFKPLHDMVSMIFHL